MPYQIMRIPQYPRNTTKANAMVLFTVETQEAANAAVKVLTDFNTRPPGPMSASLPHHFIIDPVGRSYDVGELIFTNS